MQIITLYLIICLKRSTSLPHRVAYGEESRGAAHHQNRGEDEQHILELKQDGISIHDIVAARAEFHETELLLQQH